MLFSLIALGRPLATSYAMGLAVQGGAAVAASVYLRRDLLDAVLLRSRRLFAFIAVATLSTGLVGVPLYLLVEKTLALLEGCVGPATVVVGLVLLAQATVFGRLKPGSKSSRDVGLFDALVLGVAQGLAALPGVSRSGATIAALLLLGYATDDAFRLSFLASIPVNAGATMLMAMGFGGARALHCLETSALIAALAVSVPVGLLTIWLLAGAAKRYGYRLTAALGIATVVVGLAIACTEILRPAEQP